MSPTGTPTVVPNGTTYVRGSDLTATRPPTTSVRTWGWSVVVMSVVVGVGITWSVGATVCAPGRTRCCDESPPGPPPDDLDHEHSSDDNSDDDDNATDDENDATSTTVPPYVVLDVQEGKVDTRK